ncbi:hypothetical protein CK203_055101 [Vitis vinifera]|uniref:Retrovirus-related Pol polyprotein from transposon 17.6 n=1 Tax=Vitis vinifera TaxID=29760 RepID=A0A438GUC5_VITVI|nr:hypothetical protein CK203_055101 [Vitis vinifera]
MFGEQANVIGQFKPNSNALYAILTTQVEESSKFFMEARVPQYQQPAQPSQPSQQASSLEQAIVNLSKISFSTSPKPKGIHEVETHEGESSQSAIIQCKSPLKYKDPGCPTISVMIGGKPTSITLSLADRSVKIPRGIIEDVLVQVDNFYYPVDFVVLDTDPLVKEANYVPIILGRPFLATSNAIINCRNGLMQLTFGNMTLELNIFHMSKKLITPEEEEGPEEVCIIDTLVEEHCDQNMQDELNESLEDLEEGLSEPADVLATLQGIAMVQNEKEKKLLHASLQEKTTFTCPFGTYAYRRMPFGLCNAPATFQRCMLSIFSDMVERIMEVFMDDITIYGGIVLAISSPRKAFEVDKSQGGTYCQIAIPNHCERSKAISWPCRFYRRFMQDFLSFKALCELLANDANDFAIGAVLGQREDRKPYVIYYASKTLNETQRNYTTTEKELLAMQDAKARLIRWILLLQEFDLQIRDKKGVENVVADHLSSSKRVENARQEALLCKNSCLLLGRAFLFNYCADQIIRKCVLEQEQQGILSHCHENACGGHFASQKTAMMVLQSGFTWPSLFKDSHIMYLSQCLLGGSQFLKENIFSRFGVPKVIINDGEQLIRLFLACAPIVLSMAKHATSLWKLNIRLGGNQEVEHGLDQSWGKEEELKENRKKLLRADAIPSSSEPSQALLLLISLCLIRSLLQERQLSHHFHSITPRHSGAFLSPKQSEIEESSLESMAKMSGQGVRTHHSRVAEHGLWQAVGMTNKAYLL